MVGIALTLANTAGVVVGQIFTTDTAPFYKKGLAICLGFAILAFFIILGLSTGMHLVNKRRAAAISAAELAGCPLAPRLQDGDYDVYFKYTL